MTNVSKHNLIEYWIYLIWSFITVTSFPFLAGIWFFGVESWAPLGITFFMWLVLATVLLVKRHDQQNSLYEILISHVKIGGITQAITALPGYLVFTSIQSEEWIFSIMGLVAYCGVTSVIASIFMAVYDLSLVRKMAALSVGLDSADSTDSTHSTDSTADDKTFKGYLISVLLTFLIVTAVMTDGYQYTESVLDVEGIVWLLIVSFVSAFYLNVLIQSVRELYPLISRK
jgi:hypothetical protein